MRGNTIHWVTQVDPKNYARNKGLMCTTEWTTYWGTVSWEWRMGTHQTPARDADAATIGFAIDQQPYYKAFLPGMAFGHHSLFEPWGHLAFWGKGLLNLYNKERDWIRMHNGTRAYDTPKQNPVRTYPQLACPTWLFAAGHPDNAVPFVPHGSRKQINLSFIKGQPLERNIGFSDGHVEYFKTQE